MLLHINEGNFESEVLKSDVPVMVDFFATWCNPCKMIGPFVEQLANEYEGKAKVGKLDIDESVAMAEKYKVFSVPTLLFFKNGEVVDKVVGAVPKNMLSEKLDSLIR